MKYMLRIIREINRLPNRRNKQYTQGKLSNLRSKWNIKSGKLNDRINKNGTLFNCIFVTGSDTTYDNITNYYTSIIFRTMR